MSLADADLQIIAERRRLVPVWPLWVGDLISGSSGRTAGRSRARMRRAGTGQASETETETPTGRGGRAFRTNAAGEEADD